MKVGCCGSFAERELLEDIGFDFVESAVTSELNPLSAREEFEEGVSNWKGEIPQYAFNCLLPGKLQVTGRAVDSDNLAHYLDAAFSRAAYLGAKVVVFGSGSSRNVPSDFPRRRAREQLRDFLGLAGDKAEESGIIVAIEPLRSEESNIINTLREGVELMNEVDHPRVKVLADIYHMEEENEPYEHIQEAGEDLAHVHLADSGRRYPGSGSYDYDGLMKELERVDYDGGLSIECKWGDKKDEAPRALHFLRGLLG